MRSTRFRTRQSFPGEQAASSGTVDRTEKTRLKQDKSNTLKMGNSFGNMHQRMQVSHEREGRSQQQALGKYSSVLQEGNTVREHQNILCHCAMYIATQAQFCIYISISIHFLMQAGKRVSGRATDIPSFRMRIFQIWQSEEERTGNCAPLPFSRRKWQTVVIRPNSSCSTPNLEIDDRRSENGRLS